MMGRLQCRKKPGDLPESEIDDEPSGFGVLKKRFFYIRMLVLLGIVHFLNFKLLQPIDCQCLLIM
jgi:hypothetical protein